jgi:hypothetical protein
VAIDQPAYERITREAGINEDRVDTVFNWVDTRRFQARARLPQQPQRALVFSNHASDRTQAPVVKEACEAAGIPLDIVGAESGNTVIAREHLLGDYDLVFAKSRAAIEAMAVGCAVVLCDFDGIGEMVTLNEFERLRRLNFGYRALNKPLQAEALLAQIARYDPEDAYAVCQRTRACADFCDAVDRILGAYRRAITAVSPVAARDELRSIASYLHWLNPTLKERDEVIAWARRLMEIADERSKLIDELSRVIEERTAWAESLQAEAEKRGLIIETLDRALRSRSRDPGKE